MTELNIPTIVQAYIYNYYVQAAAPANFTTEQNSQLHSLLWLSGNILGENSFPAHTWIKAGYLDTLGQLMDRHGGYLSTKVWSLIIWNLSGLSNAVARRKKIDEENKKAFKLFYSEFFAKCLLDLVNVGSSKD